MMYIKWVFDFF